METSSTALLNSRESREPAPTMTVRKQRTTVAVNVSARYDVGEDRVSELLMQHEAVGAKARNEGQDESDVKEALMNDAKEQMLMATSNLDFFLRVELLVREQWLGRADMVAGNIYRIGAFKGLMNTGSARRKERRCAGVANMLGCGLVCLVQVLGPFLILVSTINGVGREYTTQYDWSQWQFVNPDSDIEYLSDWKHIATTKLLGLCFLELFILSVLSSSHKEWEAMTEVWDIFQYLKDHTPKYEVTGNFYLFLDCFVNNWVVILCTLDAYIIIGSSRTPSELVLDSIGLLFLANLDDLGAMGFVDEGDWPGHKLGWFYVEVVHQDWAGHVISDEKSGSSTQWQTMVIHGMNNFAYFFVCVCAVALPILAVITPFLEIVPPD